MGTRNNNKRKQNRKNLTTISAPQKTIASNATKESKLLTLFNRFWKVFVGIGVVIAFIASLDSFKSLFLTDKEKHEKENFYQGDLVPSQISSYTAKSYTVSDTPLNFHIPTFKTGLPNIKGILLKRNLSTIPFIAIVGGNVFQCKKEDLEKGINIFFPLISQDSTCKLILGIKDNRLYVSTEFKDIQKEETVGFIEFNHWKLFKSNLLDFDNDENRLEVRDKQNNIVFSIKYSIYGDILQGVLIEGYFVSATAVMVINDKVTPAESYVLKTIPNWKTIALNGIAKAKSIF